MNKEGKENISETRGASVSSPSCNWQVIIKLCIVLTIGNVCGNHSSARLTWNILAYYIVHCSEQWAVRVVVSHILILLFTKGCIYHYTVPIVFIWYITFYSPMMKQKLCLGCCVNGEFIMFGRPNKYILRKDAIIGMVCGNYCIWKVSEIPQRVLKYNCNDFNALL